MLPLLSRKTSRAVDADAVERLGVAGLLLMENAGAGACRALMERFPERLGRVVLLGGTGQNGGDAWVVARHLACAGHRPACVVVGDPARIRGDAAPNFAALAALGIECLPVGTEASRVASLLKHASLIVDGIFGTGLDRPVGGTHAEWIEAMNAAAAPKVALDLPSGVDADSGAVLGVATRAALTCTFVARKRGLLQEPARACAGEVVVCGIGVPAPAPEFSGLLEDGDVLAALPARENDAHKGQAGRVAIVAGNTGTTGAALLAGTGALRTGAGLVTLMPRVAALESLDQRVLELMTRGVQEESVAGYLQGAAGFKAAVLGPGFGTDPHAQELLCGLATALPMPTVLDADALTAVAGAGLALLADAPPRVLTPHPGEAAQLLGVSSEEVQADRYAAACALAEGSGHVVVLKGAGSIIAGPGGYLRVTTRGTPAMATAGMGDVLSGMVAACMVQASPLDAACAAVQLHAAAGQQAARADRGLLASELASAIPPTLQTIRSSYP